MSTNKTFKITFIGPESENLDLLMKEMKEPTPQSLIRTLVKMRADALRNKKLTYGPSTTVPRENKETRLNEILDLDNDSLNAELERLHIFDGFRSPGMSDMWVQVTDDGIGGRTVRYGTPDGRSNGERGFGEIITALRKIL